MFAILRTWNPCLRRMIPACVVLLALVFPLHAQTLVSPSERVATRLNVRAHPATDDTVAIVGKLLRNETAALLQAVPRWFLIRLDNGVEGYVSKAWTDTFTVTAAAAEVRVRVGAWNVQKLGHGVAKDYGAVAGVIDANFDVVAIVEVMQKQDDHPGYERLLAELGDGWTGVVTATPRPRTGSGSAEFYAVLYRPRIVRLGPGWTGLRFFADHDGSADGTGADVFAREPAFAFFEVVRDGGDVACDFVLGAFHARWQSGSMSAITGEVAHVDEVLAEMAAAVPGEEDIWLVGDFNLASDDLGPLTDAADIATGSGSTLNQAGDRTANLYDHFLVADIDASDELIGAARVLDVREVVRSPDVFYGSVSDHLPLAVDVAAVIDDD